MRAIAKILCLLVKQLNTSFDLLRQNFTAKRAAANIVPHPKKAQLLCTKLSIRVSLYLAPRVRILRWGRRVSPLEKEIVRTALCSDIRIWNFSRGVEKKRRRQEDEARAARVSLHFLPETDVIRFINLQIFRWPDCRLQCDHRRLNCLSPTPK